jgi:hypothetical protein
VTTHEITQETVGNDQTHARTVNVGGVAVSVADVAEIRRCIMRAANLGVKKRRQMTYTEGELRWSGIDDECRSIKGQVPPDSDCSAFATWCYWDATRWLRLPDFVNGEAWAAGYTGTMIEHGRLIPFADAQLGDLCFYGALDAPYHVALWAGDGKVISMGRPGAPELVGVGAASMCRTYLG